jgi:hypothetical protein
MLMNHALSVPQRRFASKKRSGYPGVRLLLSGLGALAIVVLVAAGIVAGLRRSAS